MMLPYFEDAFRKLFNKPSTEAFPKAPPPPAAPGYRGRIVYHPDRCIACGLCIRVCAPQAITKVETPTPEGDTKVTMEFHMGSCTFCKTCADFCNKKAIELTDDYMIVVTDEDELRVGGSFIKKKPAPPPPPKPAPAAPAEAAPKA